MKSRTSAEITASRLASYARLEDLRKILATARDVALERVHVLRKEEQEDAVDLPADRLDVARSLEDVETDAALIERHEYQLKAIDAAYSRLEHDCYGICEKCKEVIPIERMEAMPFAAYCIDCQRKRNERRHPGEGEIDEPSRHVWTPPEELGEAQDE